MFLVNAALYRPLVTAVVIVHALSSLTAAFVTPDRGDDFWIFDAAARAWLAGGSFYLSASPAEPNLSHPLMLLLFAPFTWLSPSLAFKAWTAFNVGLALVLATIGARTSGRPWRDCALWLLAVGPSASTIVLGQVGFVLALILTLGWLAERREQPWQAGIWIGLACLLKPFFGLFLIWWCWRRAWKALSSAGLTLVCGTIAAVAFVGLNGYREWLAALGSVQWLSHLANGSVWGIAARLFAVADTAQPTLWTPLLVSPLLRAVTGTLLTLAVLGWLVRTRSTDVDRNYLRLTVAGVLVSPLGWSYYLTAAAVPLMQFTPRWWTLALLLCPPWLFVNHAYSATGTLIIGSFVSVTALSLLRSSRHDPLHPQEHHIFDRDVVGQRRRLRIPDRGQSPTGFGPTRRERDIVSFVDGPATSTPERQ